MTIAATGDSCWPDLNSEILVSITARVSLIDYRCLRGVCTAWSSALAPASYPHLLSLAADDNGRHIASVVSLPTQLSFHLHTLQHNEQPLHGHAQVVGSSNGRFVVAVDQVSRGETMLHRSRILLVDPRAGEQVELAPPPEASESVRKVVFAPGPDDGTLVALYDCKKVAYIDVTASRDRWTAIDVVTNNTEYLVDMAFDSAGKVYLLDKRGGVRVLRMPPGGQEAAGVVAPLPTLVCNADVYPAAAFAPPYDVVSTLASIKHIFFCNGGLYQLWQNSAAANLGVRNLRMSSNEIFVLRYDPERWPCWDVVKNLDGCSVFIGKNSSPVVVARAGGAAFHGVRGVRADCVYWINRSCVPMVCNVATGSSEPCVLLPNAPRGECWYFQDGNMTIDDCGRN